MNKVKKKLDFSKSPINKREKIYKKILKDKSLKRINNCSFEGKITHLKEINELLNIYIKENLELSGQKVNGGNILNANEKKILKIKNISANGAIYPKNEIQLIYNLIIHYVFRSIKSVLRYIDLVNYPTIRFKSSLKKGKKKNPFKTEKLHSDAWSGIISDAVISIPISGDITNNSVLFFETDKVSPDFFSKQKNYEIGENLYNKKKKIYKLKKGKWLIFDHSILHKSEINQLCKPRISIDMLVKMKNNKKKINKKNQIQHYYPTNYFEYLGQNKYIHSMESYHELLSRKKNKSISQKITNN